jgi:hypothetical protein
MAKTKKAIIIIDNLSDPLNETTQNVGEAILKNY